MEELLKGDQIISILKLGLIGLVFIIIFFTFRLLKTEQKKEAPNTNILKSVKNFSVVTILFAVIVGGFSILEMTFQPKRSVCDDCIDDLEIVLELSNSPAQSKETLRQLIANKVGHCVEEMKRERENQPMDN